MTFALTACLILTVAGFLVLLDRKDRREREERGLLLQRIQAPEVAVAQAASTGAADLPAVNLEVDEDYWSAQEDALNRIAQIEAGKA